MPCLPQPRRDSRWGHPSRTGWWTIFRVVLFGKDRPWNTLQALTAFEEQDRQRRVFGSTSEEIHGQHPSPSNTDHIDRRFRGMSGSEPGGDCQRKLILEPEMKVDKNAHRPALKDITNTLGGTRVQGLDAAQELRDQERPHVSDLWCANPGQAVFEPRLESRGPSAIGWPPAAGCKTFSTSRYTRCFPMLLNFGRLMILMSSNKNWTDGAQTLWHGPWSMKSSILDTFVELPPPQAWRCTGTWRRCSYTSVMVATMTPTWITWDSWDKLGYGRAAVTRTTTLLPTLHLIAFQNGNPNVDKKAPDQQEPDTIPDVRPRQGLMRQLSTNLQLVTNTTSSCHLTAGASITDFSCPFWYRRRSATTGHCRTGNYTRKTYAALLGMPSGDIHRDYDRLVLYIHGSSFGSLKHKDPRHLEETGTPDAWSFRSHWGICWRKTKWQRVPRLDG